MHDPGMHNPTPHDWLGFLRVHLPALAVRPERENEILAELALQLEQAYTDALLGGASEEEAARRARMQLGDWDKLARAIEAAERPAGNPGGWLTGSGQDVRYAFRFLRKNPVFAAIAIATLAFGIGANTAVFTMVDAIALRSLPYRDPDRLMAIETRQTQRPEMEPWTSALDFFDFRDRAQSFSAVAGLSPIWNVVLTGRGAAERLEALYVSADLFPMLGVNAALGRCFLPREDRRMQPSLVVLLSHSLWQRRFGASRDALGQSLTLDGAAYTVIGVMPAGFRYAGEPVAGGASDIDAWFPLSANPIITSLRAVRFLKVVGRLKPGIGEAQARGEIRRIGAALADQYPESNRGYAWDAQPLSTQVAGRVRATMILLLGTVGFVLLMACANVANLLLARAVARHREIAVRIALGASGYRLLRQLLTEGLVLAALGGAAGIPLAYLGLKFLIATGPPTLLRAQEIRLDARALAFTTVAVLVCAILAGLPPAWRMVRAEIGNALRAAGRGITIGHKRIRSVLVIAQVAVALVLLVGAGLLIRSFQHLLEIDPGFDARNVITISTQLPASARTREQRTSVYRLMRDRLAAEPGVVNVAAVSRLPFMGKNLGSWAYIEGKSAQGEPGFEVEYRVATASYFATMGIPLRAGRLFDDHDDANAAAVVLINETMARKFWPGGDAVGKRIKLSATPERAPWIAVVGVVGDVRHFGLEAAPRPEIYRPYAVNPLGAPVLVIRTRADAAASVSALAKAIRSVHPDIPAYSQFPMQDLVNRSTTQRRFVMMLLAGFALAALLLAGIGIYGTVSQSVVQRTQEIGLRVALGASPGAVLHLIFGEGFRLMAIGIGLGSAAAAGMAWLMRTLLFEVGPLDPVAFLAAALTLGVFALLACYVPARRATRVDPMIALRND
jgi:predicted permease